MRRCASSVEAVGPSTRRRSSSSSLHPWIRKTSNSEFDPKTMWCFVSWNVNGLRSLDKLKYTAVDHPLLAVVRDTLRPDVLCLQETKLSQPQQPSQKHPLPENIGVIPGYSFADSISVAKKGYSGTRTYVRDSSDLALHGVVHVPSTGPQGEEGHPADDEGRAVVSTFGRGTSSQRSKSLTLLNSYIPNSGMALERLDFRVKSFDKGIRAQLSDLHARSDGHVIWTGDLNVAERDYDRYFATNFKAMQKVPGFTPEERASFRKTLSDTNMVDSFRHVYPNASGAYTFWSAKYNAKAKGNGWRLDYFVVSAALANRVVDSFMLPDVCGSDHCPIVLWLKKK